MTSLPAWDFGSAALLRDAQSLLAAPALAWLDALGRGWRDDPLLRLDRLILAMLPAARATSGSAARAPRETVSAASFGLAPSWAGFDLWPLPRRPAVDEHGAGGARPVLPTVSGQLPISAVASRSGQAAEVTRGQSDIGANRAGFAAQRMLRAGVPASSPESSQGAMAANVRSPLAARAVARAGLTSVALPAAERAALATSIDVPRRPSGAEPSPLRPVPATPQALYAVQHTPPAAYDFAATNLPLPGTLPSDPPALQAPAKMRLVEGLPALQGLLQAAVAESQQHLRIACAAPTAPAASALPAAAVSPAPATLALRALPTLDALAEEMLVDRLADRLQDRLRDDALRHFGFTGGLR